mgnify:CR=1 FL=1
MEVPQRSRHRRVDLGPGEPLGRTARLRHADVQMPVTDASGRTRLEARWSAPAGVRTQGNAMNVATDGNVNKMIVLRSSTVIQVEQMKSSVRESWKRWR